MGRRNEGHHARIRCTRCHYLLPAENRREDGLCDSCAAQEVLFAIYRPARPERNYDYG